MNSIVKCILLLSVSIITIRTAGAQQVNKAHEDLPVNQRAALPDTGYYTDSRGDATYKVENMEGFKVLINTRALEHPETKEAIAMLKDKLAEFPKLMNKKHLKVLEKIPVWMDWDLPKQQAAMCFHPSRQWLIENGLPPEKSPGVQIYNVKNFISWQKMNQPYMVLHEFSHGYHYLVLGFDNQEVKAAYDHAVKSGKYGVVAYHYPGDPKRMREAYAATNPMEYFAELTEAYLGENDFYPFNRKELKTYDKEGYALMKKIWGK